MIGTVLFLQYVQLSFKKPAMCIEHNYSSQLNQGYETSYPGKRLHKGESWVPAKDQYSLAYVKVELKLNV
jgi:hypothetical protein